MSRAYITCYRDMGFDSNARPLQVPATPPLAELAVDITHESLQSDTFPPYTHFIFVKVTDDCHLAFGADPEAVSGFHKLESGEGRFYGVQPGQKIAVIGD